MFRPANLQKLLNTKKNIFVSVMKTKQLIDISSLTTSVVRSSFILDLELVDEVFHN